MAANYKMLVIRGQEEEVVDLGAAQAQPLRIRVLEGVRYQIHGADAAAPAIKVRRIGKDLQLWLDGQSKHAAVLEGYYDLPPEAPTALFGRTPDGVLHEYLARTSDQGLSMTGLSESAEALPLVLAPEAWEGSGAAVAALAPLAAGPGALAAALGGLAAAAAGGGGGNTATSLTPAQALDAIKSAAQANNASSTSLPLTTYSSAGVTGVTSANLAAINDALNSAGVTGDSVGNLPEVQALVNAYNKVLAAANGTDGDSTALPTASDYTLLGVTGVEDASVVALLSDVVDVKANAEVDTVAELQTLSDAAKAVSHYSGQSGTAPTATQINKLVAGFKFSDGSSLSANPVDEVTLTTVLARIQAANADGTVITTQSELADIVNTAPSYNTAISKLTIFASLETKGLIAATHPVPAVADYAAANVTGVTADQLDAINDALASGPVTGDWSKAPLQTLVDAYTAILVEANDTNGDVGDNVPDATPTSDPSAAQYTAIGVTLGSATTPENLALLNDVVGASQRSDVDTIAELNTLVSIVNAIQSTAAGQSPSTPLTLSDLGKIGLNTSGLNSSNFPFLLQAIAAKADDGSQTNSLTKLQTLIDQFDKTPPPTPSAAPASYKDDVGAIVNETSTAAVTDDTTPGIFVGKGLEDTPGLYIDGVKVSASYDSATGWITPTVPVGSSGADGTSHQFRYTLTDANGNESGQSPALQITVDTVAPTTAAPVQFWDDAAAQPGWRFNGSTTTDTTPSLQLEDTPGTTVHFYVDGQEVPVHHLLGNHTYTPDTALSLGQHTLAYKLTDAAGNTSALSAGLTLTVSNTVSPVVIDLNGDGQLSYGQALMDVNGDGVVDLTAWAAPQDGVLVRDANHDGRVTSLAEFAFARHAGETDLQGLAALYDGNGDGVLDARDALFGEFAVWQDANGNGVSDPGELHSLADLGIAAVGLRSDGVAREPVAGVHEAGRTAVQMQDGRTLLAADAAFDYTSAHVVARLHLQDVLSQPRQVDGQTGDVLQLLDVSQAPNAISTTLHGQAYRGYDLNQDGQLDLLVQQAVALQWHA